MEGDAEEEAAKPGPPGGSAAPTPTAPSDEPSEILPSSSQVRMSKLEIPNLNQMPNLNQEPEEVVDEPDLNQMDEVLKLMNDARNFLQQDFDVWIQRLVQVQREQLIWQEKLIRKVFPRCEEFEEVCSQYESSGQEGSQRRWPLSGRHRSGHHRRHSNASARTSLQPVATGKRNSNASRASNRSGISRRHHGYSYQSEARTTVDHKVSDGSETASEQSKSSVRRRHQESARAGSRLMKCFNTAQVAMGQDIYQPKEREADDPPSRSVSPNPRSLHPREAHDPPAILNPRRIVEAMVSSQSRLIEGLGTVLNKAGSRVASRVGSRAVSRSASRAASPDREPMVSEGNGETSEGSHQPRPRALGSSISQDPNQVIEHDLVFDEVGVQGTGAGAAPPWSSKDGERPPQRDNSSKPEDGSIHGSSTSEAAQAPPGAVPDPEDHKECERRVVSLVLPGQRFGEVSSEKSEERASQRAGGSTQLQTLPVADGLRSSSRSPSGHSPVVNFRDLENGSKDDQNTSEMQNSESEAATEDTKAQRMKDVVGTRSDAGTNSNFGLVQSTTTANLSNVPHELRADYKKSLSHKSNHSQNQTNSQHLGAPPTGKSHRSSIQERIGSEFRTARAVSSRFADPIAQVSKSRMKIFVESSFFSGVSLVVILLNTIFIGVNLQQNMRVTIGSAGEEGERTLRIYETVEQAFCYFFTFEVVVRIGAGPTAFVKGSDRWWNFFDFTLVLACVVDILLKDLTEDSTFTQSTHVRVIRIVRMARIMRIIRLMRFFRSLRLMVYSIIHSMISLIWVFLLLLSTIYVFTVSIMHLVLEHYKNESQQHGEILIHNQQSMDLMDNFTTMQDCLTALFMAICGGRDWHELYDPLADVSMTAGFMFIIYIFFVVFGVLNTVTGAFVDSMRIVSQQDHDVLVEQQLKKEERFKSEIRSIFEEADADESGSLSYEEFESHLMDPRVKAYFATLQLDVSQARALFALLDVEENNEVMINEFIDGCLRMRGDAKSIDVNMLLYENEKMLCKMTDFTEYAEDQFDRIHRALGIQGGKRQGLDLPDLHPSLGINSQGSKRLSDADQGQASLPPSDLESVRNWIHQREEPAPVQRRHSTASSVGPVPSMRESGGPQNLWRRQQSATFSVCGDKDKKNMNRRKSLAAGPSTNRLDRALNAIVFSEESRADREEAGGFRASDSLTDRMSQAGGERLVRPSDTAWTSLHDSD